VCWGLEDLSCCSLDEHHAREGNLCVIGWGGKKADLFQRQYPNNPSRFQDRVICFGKGGYLSQLRREKKEKFPLEPAAKWRGRLPRYLENSGLSHLFCAETKGIYTREADLIQCMSQGASEHCLWDSNPPIEKRGKPRFVRNR